MGIRISKPSPAMVISVIALSVAMGGTGYAAATIGSGQITDNSIRSKDVRNDTLTGKDVRESSLGAVRRAARVDDYVTFNVAMDLGEARMRLVKVGPVSLFGTCEEDAGNAHGYVEAETTAAHTYTYDDSDLNPGEVAEVTDISGPVDAGDYGNFSSFEPMFFSGRAGGSFDYDGESAGIIIGGPGADCRFVGALPLIPAS